MKMKELLSPFIFLILTSLCQQTFAQKPSDYEQLLNKGSALRQELISEEEFLSSLKDLPANRTPEGRIYLEILAQKQSEYFKTQLQRWIDSNNKESHPTTLLASDLDSSEDTSERLAQLQELGPDIKPRHYWLAGGVLAMVGLAYWGRNKEISFHWKGF